MINKVSIKPVQHVLDSPLFSRHFRIRFLFVLHHFSYKETKSEETSRVRVKHDLEEFLQQNRFWGESGKLQEIGR
jgi:hypothetical protein